MSDLEETLAFQLKALGIDGFEREFKFDDSRKWRADFAWPLPTGLLVEVDGGTWTNGRHTRGKGFEEDARKHNKAALMGYVTLRFTSSQVKSGEAVDVISTYLKYFGKEGA